MTSEEYLKGNSFSEFDPELNGKSACVELITALTAVEMAKREERERLMTHLIDKDALVAEIKKHLEYANNGILYAQTGIKKGLKKYERDLNAWQHCQSMCKNILSFIDTLEVKEVDFEEELKCYCNDYYNCDYPKQLEEGNCSEVMPHIVSAAKHFFKLGMQVSNKAQKGEEV